MKRVIARVLTLSAVVTAAACGADAVTASGLSNRAQLQWQAHDQQVDVTNVSTQSVRYALIGRQWMHNALADWCFGSPQCGAQLSANGTASVAYADISGGDAPETEAMLVWWTPNGAGQVAIDTAVVRLR